SCGRCHTLVATKRGRVYSFGLNGSGQLGIGSTAPKYLPTCVNGPWIEIDVKEVLLRNTKRSLYPVNCCANKDSNIYVISSSASTDAYQQKAASDSPIDVSMEIDEVVDENETNANEIGENNFIIEEPDDERAKPN